MNFKSTAIHSAILAAALALSACGGGDDAPAVAEQPAPATTVTGSRNGTLTDGPVAGVSFVTSSGVTGTTDANGRYTFNPGDTVTFTIGSLTLASAIPATEVLTPVDLANGNAAKLDNLLVLLQSLDTDSGAGISIPANAATAVTNLDLTAASGAFATSLQSGIASAGLTTTVVTAAQARAHFLAEGMKLIADNVWVIKNEQGVPTVAFKVDADGSYQHGEVDLADDAGQTGVEAGTAQLVDYDEGGYKYSSTTTLDTNGEWGLSHPQPTDRLRSIGEALVSESGDRIARMDNEPTTIVGAWQSTTEGLPAGKKAPLVLFFANGYAMMVDTVGEYGLEPGETSCSDGGVELGRYTWNATTGVLELTQNLADTNECAGLWDYTNVATQWTFTLSADGKTATAVGKDSGGDFSYTLTRVSK